MTTIAYRDGMMAADSGCWIGSAHHTWTRKVALAPDGSLWGATGNAAECAALIRWAETGEGEMPSPRQVSEGNSSFHALTVSPLGGVRLLTAHGFEEMPGAPYFAIGAGGEAAFGALYMGATAEQAVAAAIAHASGASAPVQVVRR